ncbi:MULTISPECIES: hypothetical protein [unclassified Mesorhizobium]|uniref:hypothetical protein n=1 Tax=unclassified Mesorhizobium TaxID=325217 RepID=UPI000BAEC17F|nr:MULTISPECIES: hypothetical protein [unclassified Mesorhizobium]TGT54253.1 hypothetical protein EN813_044295 [Mesorhizobium sp. M00.F.Ca.ET.170.01.1.1]AZO09961.1 hypothetical protein EJ074_13280 [Mesorhizobium sp. M3A.F.Ca.ET.080.04.2.1]PBB86432.1 hypothetical protein CK216_12330 [Mesorhizobium sp. WSM3876]RWB75647.1 MAG: hypothetical protein EOQ49_03970 [Mesorhizobium sp.]RWB86497.1 MAG: hypothetical protein EOQ52_18995 [Mesorhizobium sp.]
MTRRRSSLGFLGVFGRSGDLRQLDDALRAADLHPALVPEGVKLTIVNLMKDHWPQDPPPHAYTSVAQLCSYCVAGPETFEQANGSEATLEAERRMEAALEAGDSLDAQIVLMTLHAKLINAEVVERYGLTAE